MLEDANQDQTTDITADVPASQPDQGNETPALAPVTEESPPQGRDVQQAPMIPKWRFDELNHRMQAAEARLREQPPAAPAPQPQAPKESDYQSYDDFIRAEARFVAQQEVRQELTRTRQQDAQAAQEQAEHTRRYTAETNWSAKTQEAMTKYSDFEQKISTSIPLNSHTQAVLKNSSMAGELAYHLAGNQEIVARLNGMHPLDAAAELGRLEGNLSRSSGQPVRKPSAGIPAITPVGAGNKHGSIDPYAEGTSVEDYVRATRPPPRKR